MTLGSRQGRPRASSRETLAEAACELFLEQGYEATSVSDITARAGVSRSSFFNYFSSKHEVLWSGVDDRITDLVNAVADPVPGSGIAQVRSALARFPEGLQPDALALAFANAQAMGAGADLAREAAARVTTLADAIAAALRADGLDLLAAVVMGRAYAGAVMAALERWAVDGAGRTDLAERVREAVGYVDAMPGIVSDAARRGEGQRLA